MSVKKRIKSAISRGSSKDDVLKLIDHYCKEYNISKDEVLKLLEKKAKLKVIEDKVEKLGLSKIREDIPIEIFANRKLAPLEALVKFLREEHNLKYSEIAKLINRDQRTIWTTYNSAKKKLAAKFIVKKAESVTVKIFQDRSLGILESLVKHLRASMSYAEIAKLLNRDQRTIWGAANKK